MSSNPAHIRSGDGVSPSAFIPFCAFGGSLKALGTRAKGFTAPVCEAFEPRILNGRLCYSLDLHSKYPTLKVDNGYDKGKRKIRKFINLYI